MTSCRQVHGDGGQFARASRRGYGSCVQAHHRPVCAVSQARLGGSGCWLEKAAQALMLTSGGTGERERVRERREGGRGGKRWSGGWGKGGGARRRHGRLRTYEVGAACWYRHILGCNSIQCDVQLAVIGSKEWSSQVLTGAKSSLISMRQREAVRKRERERERERDSYYGS